MKYHKVRLSIGGRFYHLQTTENTEYLHELESELDRRVSAISGNDPSMDSATAAVLAGLDLLDEAHRRMEDQTNLRMQIKSYADDLQSKTKEVEELRQQLYDLQQEMVGQTKLTFASPEEPEEDITTWDEFEVVDEPDDLA